MVFAAILAGGTGSRMGSDLPKQFLRIADTPVIIHTIVRFLDYEKIDKIYIGINAEYKALLIDMLNQYLSIQQRSKIAVLSGGENRNKTLLKLLSEMENEADLNAKNIVITHDAVRPFIDVKTLDLHIKTVKDGFCCTSATKSVDTLVMSSDGVFIDKSVDRNLFYSVQTPQSFDLSILFECLKKLSEQELNSITDATGVVAKFGHTVKIIDGKRTNIKITTPDDLILANAIIKTQQKNQNPYEFVK